MPLTIDFFFNRNVPSPTSNFFLSDRSLPPSSNRFLTLSFSSLFLSQQSLAPYISRSIFLFLVLFLSNQTLSPPNGRYFLLFSFRISISFQSASPSRNYGVSLFLFRAQNDHIRGSRRLHQQGQQHQPDLRGGLYAQASLLRHLEAQQ